MDQLTDSDIEKRTRSLLKAIIAAAKADGHIDEDEIAIIKQKIESFGLDSDAMSFIETELAKPLNADDVALGADSPTTAAEIYLISLILIDKQNAQESAYLQELAKSLNLKQELVMDLERKMQTENNNRT